jgi:hypothetical protein
MHWTLIQGGDRNMWELTAKDGAVELTTRLADVSIE